MAFKRKYSATPKRASKRRAVARRFTASRSKASRRRKGFSLNTHSFSRFGAASTVTMSGTEQPLSFEFKLSDVYTYSEFTTLFDKYKLTKAIVYIQMISNPDGSSQSNTNSGGNACNFYPKMWYIADHDDSATTSIAAIKERVGVKSCVMRPNFVKKISVTPAVAIMMYKTATTTGYGPKTNQYIDMVDVGVPHYGLKCVFDALGLDPINDFTFRYEWKLYFTCKDVQ